jgi:hypothetical protein
MTPAGAGGAHPRNAVRVNGHPDRRRRAIVRRVDHAVRVCPRREVGADRLIVQVERVVVASAVGDVDHVDDDCCQHFDSATAALDVCGVVIGGFRALGLIKNQPGGAYRGRCEP